MHLTLVEKYVVEMDTTVCGSYVMNDQEYNLSYSKKHNVRIIGGKDFVKLINLFTKNKINPLIGNAGVSAVPDSARVSEVVGRESNPSNHLLMNAMAPNVAGVIGSAVAAGILLGFLG